MTKSGWRTGLIAVLAAAAGPALAAAPLPLELNKLEPVPQAAGAPPTCRIYMLAQNPDPVPLDQLRLDLMIFTADGVVARRIALDLGPLGANRRSVRLFDLQGMPCDGVAQILVNDVIACRTGGAQPADMDRAACMDRLTVSSRATVPLEK